LNADCKDPKKIAVEINSSLVLMLDSTPAGQGTLKKPKVEFAGFSFLKRIVKIVYAMTPGLFR